MKTPHLKTILLIAAVMVIGVATSLVYANTKKQNKIQYIDLQYAADFSDDKVLVGASHNIFIGKVVKQAGTQERGIGPETQFEVEVIDNIKGSLKGSVTIDQEGGYKNGVLYVVKDDTSTKSDNPYLLQPGSTYLLTTRYNEKEGWYTINPYPTADKLLSSSVTDVDQLKALAAKDSRVQALQVAYKNEIPLREDVKAGNALNSYQSVLKN
jgi:hypothetical protein